MSWADSRKEIWGGGMPIFWNNTGGILHRVLQFLGRTGRLLCRTDHSCVGLEPQEAKRKEKQGRRGNKEKPSCRDVRNSCVPRDFFARQSAGNSQAGDTDVRENCRIPRKTLQWKSERVTQWHVCRTHISPTLENCDSSV